MKQFQIVTLKTLVFAMVLGTSLALGSTSAALTSAPERARLEHNFAVVKTAIVVFADQAGKPAPAGLSGQQKQGYEQQSDFFRNGAKSMLELNRKTARLLANKNAPETDMSAVSLEFVALQNALKNESRKFETLSQASRARHETAMTSIRNIR